MSQKSSDEDRESLADHAMIERVIVDLFRSSIPAHLQEQVLNLIHLLSVKEIEIVDRMLQDDLLADDSRGVFSRHLAELECQLSHRVGEGLKLEIEAIERQVRDQLARLAE